MRRPYPCDASSPTPPHLNRCMACDSHELTAKPASLDVVTGRASKTRRAEGTRTLVRQVCVTVTEQRQKQRNRCVREKAAAFSAAVASRDSNVCTMLATSLKCVCVPHSSYQTTKTIARRQRSSFVQQQYLRLS